MTLATEVQILDPHPPEPLFRFCRTLLGATERYRWEHQPEPHPLWDNGSVYPASMCNVVGQGLASMCDLYYATDGPLTDRYWEEGDEGEPDPPHALSLRFDTAYGYRGSNGSGCSDLHAWLVLEVGLWCERRGLRYRWMNEFTGEWFDSVLDVHDLGDPEKGRLRPTPDEADLLPLPPPAPASPSVLSAPGGPTEGQ